MSIRVKETIEAFIECGDYYLVGPSVAMCPTHGKKGFEDMVLMADIFNSSDSAAGTMLWRSCDGGCTFTEQNMIEKPYVYDFNGSWVKSGYGALYADEKAGVLVLLANDTYWERGELKSLWRMRTLYFRLSFDNGYTWTDKRYIMQKGKDDEGNCYDSNHYLKDVTFSVNMAASVTPRVIRPSDDTIMVSVQVQIVDKNRELINPTGMGYMKCGAIKGRWNSEKLTYEWELGDYAEVTLNESTRGVYEPTFEMLGKNKVIMIMRGSNAGARERIDGVKFFSLSEDNGLTWSKPQPLKYNDGSCMYSSSSIPKLLRHSNGKLYYIGIINESNPNGNLPRYPLCIAEVDENSCSIIKNTVTVIDTKRPFHDEMKNNKFIVDYSNHGVYEDMVTGDIVVLAPFNTDLNSFHSVLNKYIIYVS